MHRGCACSSGRYSSYWIHGPGILRDMVDKRVVRILLECFLVLLSVVVVIIIVTSCRKVMFSVVCVCQSVCPSHVLINK